MSLGRRFVSTGAADAVCLTESVQVFGADSTYSSNKLLYQFENNVTNDVGSPSATNSGATFSSTAKFGSYSADFAGTTEHIDTGYNTDDSSLTHSFWMYQHSITGSYNSILGTYWDGGSGVYGYYLWSDNGTTINWRVHTSNSAYVQVTGNVSLNTWHHVVLTWSDGEGAGIYIDGVLAQFTASSLARQKNDETITLANLDTRGTSTVGYDGLLDQYRYYNKSITAQDVATLYAETDSTTSNTNLFNEGAGVALYSLDYDASEASGYYDGTPTDVIFGVGGITNFGAKFNGSSSFIQTSLSLDAASNSVSFWFNADSVGSQNPALYFNNRGGRIDITINGTGSNTATSSYENIYINSTTAITGWNFVSIVFTGWASSYSASSYGSAITANVYLNGGSAVSLSPTPYGQSDGLRIGRSGGGYYYDGSIDQVRIFSKALSTSEIDTLYNSGSGETACVHTATANTADFPSGTTTVAHYPLDNNTFDNKSTNDATSETDIEYRFGKYGQAAVFNGSTSEIITGYTPPATTTATISLWVNFKAYTNEYAILAADNNTGTTRNSFFTLATGGSGYGGSGYLWVSIGNGSSHDEDTTISFDDHGGLGNWIHVAATVSGTSVKIYMNGYETKSYTSAVSYAPSGSGYAYRLGNTTGWNPLDGKLDQVRFYSTELSSSQILELYNEKPEIDTSNFKAVLYVGNGDTSNNTYISNVGMDLETNGGLVWVKARTAYNHLWMDSVRGTGSITSNDQTVERTNYNRFQSYEANGFMIKADNTADLYKINRVSNDFVSWIWLGGGEAINIGVNSITGSTPSIASDVSANTAAGFSICKVTYNTSSPHTVAHGLNSTPEFIVSKRTAGTTSDWNCYHKFIDSSYPENYFIKLNSRDDRADNAIYWNDTAPTSDVFTTGSIYDQNETVIFYCWHSVNGYSKIGSYQGNGTTDNKIYTTDDGTSTGSYGFKPSFVMLKNIQRDNNTGWLIHDTARDPVNTSYRTIYANAGLAEYDSTTYWLMDFESDGFRLKYGADNEFNRSGDTYIYMAFK